MTIIVFISGSGTNLQTCIDMKLDIKCVISNKKKAYGLVRAKKIIFIQFINHGSKRNKLVKNTIQY